MAPGTNSTFSRASICSSAGSFRSVPSRSTKMAFFIACKGLEKSVVFLGGAHGQAQASVAAAHAGAVPDDDLVLQQVGVEGIGVAGLHQQEVGVAGPHPADAAEAGKGGGQPFPLRHDLRHFLVPGGLQGLQGQFLRGLGDIIGVLHAVHPADDAGVGEGHAQPQPRQAEGLGEGLQHHQVGAPEHLCPEAALCAEVRVSLVQHHHAGEGVHQRQQVLPRKGIAGGVVGAAEEQKPGVCIGGGQEVRCREGEVRSQRNAAQGHVVDVGRHGIHPVTGDDGHGVVLPGHAENPEQQVDGFVAAIAQEDVVHRQALEGGNLFLHAQLPGIRVAVVAQPGIGAFIGVQEDLRGALGLVAGRGIGGEAADIGPHPLFQINHRFSLLRRWRGPAGLRLPPC